MDYEIKALQQNNAYKLDIEFKTIIVGNAGVGKTAIARKGLFHEETKYYKATLSPELFWNRYSIDKKIVCLNIWDTCGQEEYNAMPDSYYRNSVCAFLVYSINDRESFNKLDFWKRKISAKASEDIQVYLIGNKTDLEAQRQVSFEEGEQYRLNNNLDYFIETSVEKEETITELFYYTLTMLYESYVNSGKKFDIDIDKKVKPKKSILLKKKPKEKNDKAKESGLCHQPYKQ